MIEEDIEIVDLNFFQRIVSGLDTGQAVIIAVSAAIVISLIILGVAFLLKERKIRIFIKKRMAAGQGINQIINELIKRGLSERRAEKLLNRFKY